CRRGSAGFRPRNHRPGSDVALIRAVEDKNTGRVAVADRDDVVHGIDSNSARAINPGLRSADGSQGRDVSVRGPGENQNRFSCRRSEEHTSELQSRSDLVCRLLLEKKKKKKEWTRM